MPPLSPENIKDFHQHLPDANLENVMSTFQIM